MSIARIRIARPTMNPVATVSFYVEGLGAVLADAFRNHAGYSGDIVRPPGAEVEIEFVHGVAMTHPPAPTPEDAIVLYLQQATDLAAISARLARLGHAPVATENPYWNDRATAFRDPDGYLVILTLQEAGDPA